MDARRLNQLRQLGDDVQDRPMQRLDFRALFTRRRQLFHARLQKRIDVIELQEHEPLQTLDQNIVMAFSSASRLFDDGLRADGIEILQQGLVGLRIPLSHDQQGLIFGFQCRFHGRDGAVPPHGQGHHRAWKQHRSLQRKYGQIREYRGIRIVHSILRYARMVMS